ncbi:putative adenine permease PurP [compost metagenome]
MITALVMPFTYSIANGLALGFISYAALKLLTGKHKEVSGMIWGIAGVFLFKTIYIAG